MTIQLTRRTIFIGFSDDGSAVAGADVLTAHPFSPVAVLVGDEAHLLPGKVGDLSCNDQGDWFLTPPPHVWVGGCMFCGGDIVTPHGHSFGACFHCGAV